MSPNLNLGETGSRAGRTLRLASGRLSDSISRVLMPIPGVEYSEAT